MNRLVLSCDSEEHVPTHRLSFRCQHRALSSPRLRLTCQTGCTWATVSSACGNYVGEERRRVYEGRIDRSPCLFYCDWAVRVSRRWAKAVHAQKPEAGLAAFFCEHTTRSVAILFSSHDRKGARDNRSSREETLKNRAVFNWSEAS